MGDVRVVPDRGALVGAMISGLFGLAWIEWGASGLPGVASTITRVAGIVVGLIIVAWSVWLRRSTGGHGEESRAPSPEGGGSLFSSPAYRIVVALEVIALFGGGALLHATGHSEFTSAWFATVVGVHFLAFGRLFWAGFYWLGIALIVAGIAGATVGVAGGGLAGIEAVAGLVSGASLFAAGGWTIARARVGSNA